MIAACFQSNEAAAHPLCYVNVYVNCVFIIFVPLPETQIPFNGNQTYLEVRAHNIFS